VVRCSDLTKISRDWERERDRKAGIFERLVLLVWRRKGKGQQTIVTKEEKGGDCDAIRSIDRSVDPKANKGKRKEAKNHVVFKALA
jgi:hypothetical protein